MSLQKQAKTLTNKQIDIVLNYLQTTRDTLRNEVIFLLSVKGGLRAIEIASLKWNHLIDTDSNISNTISLTNDISKGKRGGRLIPINKVLKQKLIEYYDIKKKNHYFDISDNLIHTQRSKSTTPQCIVNMFQIWYKDLNLIGCSSHSGRRTAITNWSRKITTVGGSLKDVQQLAGHSSLKTTSLYIEGNENSKLMVVDL
tara:strand:- start:1473 stop:2069 length:597 start_codon:yes stop_codon:yes gene_type:complete